ncbi:hypothetical protein OG978_33540 [Streptomyces sp. NBC_01591]|uniref:hypothetical protein n=1 Tax=Streptomyces sp. NBC_01591 TaxID=2975888 RepID=UPI002DDC4F53|nr:hypothetical protein [Streptomyces sp. NBC_01591]WSD71885.1 hypothetical protein OG978_33540 [Streptomyces sp. NBC_01591]
MSAPMTPDAALIRLRQYGERTSTWSTATHNDGTEKALHGIALTLAAELEQYRAMELGTAEGRVSAKCEHAEHPVWLRDLDDVRGCPWCELDRVRAELAALPAPVVETAFRDALGNVWPVGHFPAETEARVLETTPTIQRTVRTSEWTEVTS